MANIPFNIQFEIINGQYLIVGLKFVIDWVRAFQTGQIVELLSLGQWQHWKCHFKVGFVSKLPHIKYNKDLPVGGYASIYEDGKMTQCTMRLSHCKNGN